MNALHKDWYRYCVMVLGCILIVSGGGCRGTDFDQPYDKGRDSSGDPNDTDSDPYASLLGIGAACETSSDCRPDTIAGLVLCDDGVIDDNCVPPPMCSSTTGTCQYPTEEGAFPVGAPCFYNDHCAMDLVCANEGTCQEPGAPGTVKEGENCQQDSDCVFALGCKDGTCAGIQYPFAFWEGAACEETTASDDFVGYFDINRTSEEFYRLPFPNDVLLKDDGIDMSGHPNPGEVISGRVNPVDVYLAYVAGELDGFGTNSSIFFRFSQTPDWDSLRLMETVYIVNIDSESPDYGKKVSTGYSGSSGRGMYICSNWVALRPSMGTSLAHNTTYAAVFTTDIKDRNGASLTPASEFVSMMDSSRPSGDLASAWDAYEPLRQWVTGEGISPATIGAATVFTTQDSFAAIPRIRQQVRSEAPPALDGTMKEEAFSDYIQYTGRVSIPFFQQGDRPFREEGGGFKYDSTGRPVWVEDENVAFALTVPTGAAPATGWPVFLYAHGTGGDEQSFIQGGTAQMFAQLGVAMISLEQVQHGERRGLNSDEDDAEHHTPEMLFYNFLNPYAAVGNNLQAAADYFQLIRFVEMFSVVTDTPVVFDSEKMYFFGHSQGTQGQYVAAIHEPLIKGIVLSGAGGFLTESLLGKKQPVDLTMGIRYVLSDLDVTASHPMISVVQMAMEQVDPINYSKGVYRNELPDGLYPHRDVFMSFGIDDSYSPEKTQAALARSLWLDMDTVSGHQVSAAMTEIDTFPWSGSRTYDGTSITTVAVQYEPDAYDGHFVMFRHPRALAQLPHFVTTMIATDTVAELIDGY